MRKGRDGENGMEKNGMENNGENSSRPPDGDRLQRRRSCQNKFFDQSAPSMRNIEPPAKSKMAARGPKNGRQGLERGATLDYWALRSTFAK